MNINIKFGLMAVIGTFCLNTFSQIVPDSLPNDPNDQESSQQKISRSEMKRAAKALWYYQKVDQYALTSKYIKRLQERLEKDQIIGLELVIAAPTISAIESRWGHSMMRFVDNVGTPADDVMFGFVAEVDELKINYAKGMIGSYPTYPALQSLRLFNQQYIKDQDRPLERFIVPSTKKLREQMVNKLVAEWNELEIENSNNYQREITQSLSKIRDVKARKKFKDTKFEILKTDSGLIYAFILTRGDDVVYTEPVYFRAATSKELGGYTFLGNNCAGALIYFLKDLQLISKKSLGMKGRIPVDLPQYFAQNGLTYLPKLLIPGIYDLKVKILKILNLKVEDLYNFEKWPKNAGKEFATNLTLKEKIILLDTYPMFPDEVIASIKESIPKNELRPDYEQTYGIVTVNPIVYGVCQNVSCAKSQSEAVSNGKEELISNLKAVHLNQEKLSADNYTWLNEHYQSFKQLLIEQGDDL